MSIKLCGFVCQHRPDLVDPTCMQTGLLGDWTQYQSWRQENLHPGRTSWRSRRAANATKKCQRQLTTVGKVSCLVTLPETNSEYTPENGWLE